MISTNPLDRNPYHRCNHYTIQCPKLTLNRTKPTWYQHHQDHLLHAIFYHPGWAPKSKEGVLPKCNNNNRTPKPSVECCWTNLKFKLIELKILIDYLSPCYWTKSYRLSILYRLVYSFCWHYVPWFRTYDCTSWLHLGRTFSLDLGLNRTDRVLQLVVSMMVGWTLWIA